MIDLFCPVESKNRNPQNFHFDQNESSKIMAEKSSNFSRQCHDENVNASTRSNNSQSANRFAHQTFPVKEFHPRASNFSQINQSMSQLSIRQHRPTTHLRSRANFDSFDNSFEIQNVATRSKLHADSPVFTPSLMSIHFPTEPSFYPVASPLINSTTNVSQQEFYVDRFASNFSDKPSKSKVKHVTFAETNSPSNGFEQSSTTSPQHVYHSTRVSPRPSTSNFPYNPYAKNFYPQRFRGVHSAPSNSSFPPTSHEKSSRSTFPPWQSDKSEKNDEPKPPVTILKKPKSENEQKQSSPSVPVSQTSIHPKPTVENKQKDSLPIPDQTRKVSSSSNENLQSFQKPAVENRRNDSSAAINPNHKISILRKPTFENESKGSSAIFTVDPIAKLPSPSSSDEHLQTPSKPIIESKQEDSSTTVTDEHLPIPSKPTIETNPKDSTSTATTDKLSKVASSSDEHLQTTSKPTMETNPKDSTSIVTTDKLSKVSSSLDEHLQTPSKPTIEIEHEDSSTTVTDEHLQTPLKPTIETKQKDSSSIVTTDKVSSSSGEHLQTTSKPTIEIEQKDSTSIGTTDQVSFSSDELLSILQSANCIAALNEFSQQKKFNVSYEYSSPSPLTFSCVVSINGRSFDACRPCSSKAEAQKFACEETLKTLYRENSSNNSTSIKIENQHDLIAQKTLQTFQNLDLNAILTGRKTLASILYVEDENFAEAHVISLATGNICLDEKTLIYADDGTALHDCHAEILARRGFIRFLFEEMKRSQNSTSKILQFDSIRRKFSVRQQISFHFYVSSCPCGGASSNSSVESLRYKQGQIEGSLLASTSSLKFPIKSCSDKICRWNVLGIQGAFLINFFDAPIYLQSITIGCEPNFSRENLFKSLATRFFVDENKISSPFRQNRPKIDFPTLKFFQNERQVAKLQNIASAWNISRPETTELIEPISGFLKENRSSSALSKKSFFKDFSEFIRTNFPNETSLKFETYQQAKRLDRIYVETKSFLEENFHWRSKSNELEKFSN